MKERTEFNCMKNNDVSNRHMTWWRNAWWIRDGQTDPHMRTAPEAVDESGEQPEEQPNRLVTMKGSKRPRVLPKRQRERRGEEKKRRERQKQTVQ